MKSPKQLKVRRLSLSEHEKVIELLIMVNCQLWESQHACIGILVNKSPPSTETPEVTETARTAQIIFI